MSPTLGATISRIVSGIGSGVTLSSMLYMAQGFSVLLNGFALWVLAPYAILFAASFLTPTRPRSVAAFTVTVLVTGFAMWCYADAALFSRSSTVGLVFVFVPFYQIIPAAFLTATLLLLRRADRRSKRGAN